MVPTVIVILTTLDESPSMCIVGTRFSASTPLDTARPTPTAACLVAPLARGLRAASAGASAAGSAPAFPAFFAALPAGTARAAPTTIHLIHPTRPTPASLHIFLLNGPLNNNAALQHDLNRGFR